LFVILQALFVSAITNRPRARPGIIRAALVNNRVQVFNHSGLLSFSLLGLVTAPRSPLFSPGVLANPDYWADATNGLDASRVRFQWNDPISEFNAQQVYHYTDNGLTSYQSNYYQCEHCGNVHLTVTIACGTITDNRPTCKPPFERT
jgi:hypothetical protein